METDVGIPRAWCLLHIARRSDCRRAYFISAISRSEAHDSGAFQAVSLSPSPPACGVNDDLLKVTDIQSTANLVIPRRLAGLDR